MRTDFINYIQTLIAANSIYNPANPIFNHRVQDDKYDVLIYNGLNWTWQQNQKQNVGASHIKTMDMQTEQKTLIVVLESPHVKEYDKNGTPLHPLKNDSAFKRLFPSAIATSNHIKLCQKSTYCVHLVNPIQLQCSLGYPTECFRDLVFLYYWDVHKWEDDFRNRLTKLINDSGSGFAGVINLCTQGKHCNLCVSMGNNAYPHLGTACDSRFFQLLGINLQNVGTKPNSLQDLVGEVISSCTSLSTTGYHPSSWAVHNKKQHPLIN